MSQSQITLSPTYINPPKAGKKYGSINANGIYYSVDPAKIPLTSFQKGVPVTFDYTTSAEGYHTIIGIVSTPAAQAANAAAPRGNSDWSPEKEERVTRVAIAKSCIEANVGIDIGQIWLDWIKK